MRISGIFTSLTFGGLSPLERFVAHGISKEIAPCSIVFLDQFNFPIPPPALHLAFTFSRAFSRLVAFEID